MGNKENHSTANDSNPNTSIFVSNLEASKTEAKMAALVDNDPGILQEFSFISLWCATHTQKILS